MYAVFVIAAILLSVSPMHARTLLAALPASTPGHQFASDDLDQDLGQRATSSHLPLATRSAARLNQASYSERAVLIAGAPSAAPAFPAEATGLLEHAPNAP